jgi:flagellar export protein FliJ
MKFNFRLKTLMKQRKVEQDVAQREYSEAQHNVTLQLTKIRSLYDESDFTRFKKQEAQKNGTVTSTDLNHMEEFIEGTKVRIKLAREEARELMAIAEEKHEILAEKAKDHKVMEKLQEKRLSEFKKAKNKRMHRQLDDLMIMRNHKKDGRL